MLNEENLFLNVNATKKEEVLEFIADKAFKLNICKDKQGLLQDLKKREEEFSTGLQDGFAIPHAKSKYVTTPTILFLKTDKGIDWGTMDDKKVNYLFALLVPSENENNIHLQMISKLTTCLLEDDFKEKIKIFNDLKDLKEYILKNMEV